jgi:pimeloyl-ACP methyl ester carboxylesterase
MFPVVLVHGGLYEEMTPEIFWEETGIVDGLTSLGLTVAAPQRPVSPSTWQEEGDAVALAIRAHGFERVALVGASNGCSAAVRATLQHPQLVARLMLCWPATCGDEVVDKLARVMISDAAGAAAAEALVAGQTLRGVDDVELGTIQIPTVVHPALPESKVHQRTTSTRLLGALRDPMLVAGSPEPLDPAFARFRDTFARLVLELATVDEDDDD